MAKRPKLFSPYIFGGSMNGADCGMMGGACCWFITITGCHFFFWCSHVYENCNYSAVLRSNSAIDRVICASIESCGFEQYFDSAKLAGGRKKGVDDDDLFNIHTHSRCFEGGTWKT